jgi:hypothetical protein
MITVTIYNSKDKVQKQFKNSTWRLAMQVLDRVRGKIGWYAKAEYDDGDMDILHYLNGEWYN